MQGTDVQLSEARQGRWPGGSGEEDRRFDDQAWSGAKCDPRRDTTHFVRMMNFENIDG